VTHRLGRSRNWLLVDGDFFTGLVRWERDRKLVANSEAPATVGVEPQAPVMVLATTLWHLA
jgi:hypothetical protein